MHGPQYKLKIISAEVTQKKGGLGMNEVSQGELTQKIHRKLVFEGCDEHELGPKSNVSKSMIKAQRQGLVRQQWKTTGNLSVINQSDK